VCVCVCVCIYIYIYLVKCEGKFVEQIISSPPPFLTAILYIYIYIYIKDTSGIVPQENHLKFLSSKDTCFVFPDMLHNLHFISHKMPYISQFYCILFIYFIHLFFLIIIMFCI